MNEGERCCIERVFFLASRYLEYVIAAAAPATAAPRATAINLVVSEEEEEEDDMVERNTSDGGWHVDCRPMHRTTDRRSRVRGRLAAGRQNCRQQHHQQEHIHHDETMEDATGSSDHYSRSPSFSIIS